MSRFSITLSAALLFATACGRPSEPAAGVEEPSDNLDAGVPPGHSEGGAPAPVGPSIRGAGAGALSVLADAGVTLDPPPDFATLPKPVKRMLMDSFNSSLGVGCEYCHADWKPNPEPSAAAAAAKNRRIAGKMWTSFVQGFRLASGEPLYCDSCHQGQAKVLNRTGSVGAMGEYMFANYVQALQPVDTAKAGCNSCHAVTGDKFLDAWGAAVP